jgi:outer membrane protein
MKRTTILAAALAAAAFTAGSAHAQSAGSWGVTVNATQVTPNVSSGDLSPPSSPGTQIGVGSDLQPTVSISWMATDHLSVAVPIGAGFRQEITGAGSIAGVGKIGTVKSLPVTVLGQYRFLEPNARLRPYVQAGVTYVHFYDESGSAALDGTNPLNPVGGHTGLSVDSKWAGALGVGATFNVNDKWYVEAQWLRVFLKTTAHLSTGQSIAVKLDPDVVSIGVGMRF